MLSFKELETYLINLVYDENPIKEISRFESLDKYDKQKIMRCLSTFFMLDPKFTELANILSHLATSFTNFKDIVQYVREYAKKTSKSNIWFLTGNKYDYYSKLLVNKFPKVFSDEFTSKMFIMTYPDECSHICKFLDDPKYTLAERSKELFDELINISTNEKNIKNDTTHFYGEGRYILNNLIFTTDLTKDFSRILDQKFNSNEDHFCYECKYKKNSYVLFDEIVNDSNRHEVDVLFMGMNPYKDEVEHCRPFSGKAGKHLRNLINNSNMQHLNIVIFNTVPCFIENNGDPEESVFSKCVSKFASKVISYLKPKVVVFLGDVALSGFYYMLKSKNIDDEKCKEICKNLKHNIIKIQSNYIAHTYHPSYLNYNHNLRTYEKMIEMFNNICLQINPSIVTSTVKPYVASNSYDKKSYNNNVKYLRRNPKDFYKEIIDNNYWLTNVVFLDESTTNEKYTTKRIIARFRNINDNNDTFLVDISDLITYEYYVLKSDDELYEPIKQFDKVVQKEVSLLDYINKKFIRDDINKLKSYEGDIDEFDYPMFKFGETANYKEVVGLHKVCFTDIETLSEAEIPDEKNAIYPIPVVTSIIDDVVYVYVSYSTINKYKQITRNEIENYVKESFQELIEEFKQDSIAAKLLDNEIKISVKIFNDDSELIRETMLLWATADVLTGWNSYYDLNYLVSRSKVLGIDKFKLDKFSTNSLLHKKYNQHAKNIVYQPHRSYRYGFYMLPGMTMIDMLDIYKTSHKLESYSLDFVSKLEFENIKKMNIEGTFVEQLKNDVKTFLKYNINDTFLTYLIDKKKKIIQPLMGLSSISFCTLTTSTQNLKIIDGFLFKYSRKRNCVVRNKRHYDETFQKLGGYVRKVGKEQNKLVSCFDVASMYPNIIISYNISFDSNIGHIKGQFIDNEQMILEIVESISYFVKKLVNMENITEDEINKYNKQFVFVYDPLTTNKQVETTSYELAKIIHDKDYLITPRGTVFRNKPDGLSVEMMRDLIEQRKGYKKKAALTGDPVAELFSLTYKLAANAYYGANGAEDFRFFNPYNAETITLIGQMIIRTVQVITNDYITEQIKGEVKHGTNA